MNIIYATIVVIGINAALLFSIFKGVEWLNKWQESKKNDKATS